MTNDFKGMMDQAKRMQEKMKELQDGLASLEVEGSAGGGLVKITITGKGEVKKINIDDISIGFCRKVGHFAIIRATIHSI